MELEKERVMRDAIVGAAVGGPYSPAVVSEGRFVLIAGQGLLHDGVYVPGSTRTRGGRRSRTWARC
jgi:hypothetical protein